jgi:hypothetical protein
VLGAGAVRLFSGLPAIPEMVLAGVLGTLVGLATLALLSPAMFRELRIGVASARRRTGPSPPTDPSPPLPTVADPR